MQINQSIRARLAELTEPLVTGEGSAIPALDLGTFDVTVANILAGPIIRLQPILAKLTKPGEAPHSCAAEA